VRPHRVRPTAARLHFNLERKHEMNAKFKQTALAIAVGTAMCASALAVEGPVPKGVRHLDHVFVIMMENHGYGQIVGNADEPYLNGLISSGTVNVATNYFAVGHPSLTNYLEVAGGSNFGVRSDHLPAWHSTSCTPNLATGVPTVDNNAGAAPYPVVGGNVCPITGTGSDAVTEAVDTWNEVSAIPGTTPKQYTQLADIDGVISVAARNDIDGKTIADQIAAAGGSWKAYEESLPFAGADNVSYSNGTVTDLTFSSLPNVANLPASPGGYVLAYAAKHNPFVYFKSVQENTMPGLGLSNVVAFDGTGGLYADLATGNVPQYAFIAPNQCNDQHGRGNGDSFCAFDNYDDGTQAGLNPGLIAQGDATLQRIVSSIKSSSAWQIGRSAIVILWDENDYSGVSTPLAAGTPYPGKYANNVLVTVESNHRHHSGVTSSVYYNHFSLLKTIEGALGLPCLNHACDAGVQVMSDLFGGHDD
jgi:phosphatidylinositol-3-phosphatase